MKLLKNTGNNEHLIELVHNKQLPYKHIYTLSLIELETLKTDIETNLKTGFIQFLKSLAIAFIFFNKKLNDSFCLWVNH